MAATYTESQFHGTTPAVVPAPQPHPAAKYRNTFMGLGAIAGLVISIIAAIVALIHGIVDAAAATAWSVIFFGNAESLVVGLLGCLSFLAFVELILAIVLASFCGMIGCCPASQQVATATVTVPIVQQGYAGHVHLPSLLMTGLILDFRWSGQAWPGEWVWKQDYGGRGCLVLMSSSTTLHSPSRRSYCLLQPTWTATGASSSLRHFFREKMKNRKRKMLCKNAQPRFLRNTYFCMFLIYHDLG